MTRFGTKAANLKNGVINEVKCTSCQQEVDMIYSVYGKYFFVGILPFFPLKKVKFAECKNCKKTFGESDFSNAIENKIDADIELNGVIKFPLWTYSGLVVIPLIVLGVYLYHKNNESNTADYVKKPLVGDVYTIREDNQFTTLRVDKVSNDSVYFTINDYTIGRQDKINRIDKPENYTNQKTAFSKEEIIQFHAKDSIVNIDRD
ncbi:MAG: hypothetical protein QM535_11720 [Limnohabitans sp.]|nr:hypothetical protein [Limnohabitans sp.]